MIKVDGEKCVYKARYIARGYSQVQGIDYLETFSPTARIESVRMLMHLAVQSNWLLHQMDVKGAYLHAPIQCYVYVSQPLVYEITDKDGKTSVWK